MPSVQRNRDRESDVAAARAAAAAKAPVEGDRQRRALDRPVGRGGFFKINARATWKCARTTVPGRLNWSRRFVARDVDLRRLFRFDQILRRRVRDIEEGFAAAIDEANYKGAYHLAYPVKATSTRSSS